MNINSVFRNNGCPACESGKHGINLINEGSHKEERVSTKNKLDTSQKIMIFRIIISLILFAAALSVKSERIPDYAIFTVTYIFIGWDIILRAFKNILRGKIFDENFLMTIATIGAFIIGEYPEAAAVMLFYQSGEFFQDYAVGKSRKSITELMDIRPDYAVVEINGQMIQTDPQTILPGEIITVMPGAKIPLDGEVSEGTSSIDTSALTGESLPKEVQPGDPVISGCVNLNGLLKIKVNKSYGESTVSKILSLVENSSSRKARAENFITRFAGYYTPAVVACASLIAVIPPFFMGAEWSGWIERALIFLVISCPCALVVSIPLTFFGGIGGASKKGILIKGSNYLEALSAAGTVVFDKTGTLTKGTFSVTAVHPEEISEEKLLEIASLSVSYSDHPVSRSLKRAYSDYGKNHSIDRISDFKEIPGSGVTALIDGKACAVGNYRLMDNLGIKWKDCSHEGNIIHTAIDGKYMGHVVVADTIREDSAAAIALLKKCGIHTTAMLTGDTVSSGKKTGAELGIDIVHAGLLPTDKVAIVEEMLKNTSAKGKLIFVGDGINDAPVLARADIGIAMGGLGSDAAIEAADVVLMNDSPSRVPTAIKIARRTKIIVWQNIVFALGVKIAVLTAGAFGAANMWQAVFADVGVALIAVLNASRALRVKDI